MTIEELIKTLSDYDPEMEIKASAPDGSTYDFDNHVWQWDNSGDEVILNTYLTIELK